MHQASLEAIGDVFTTIGQGTVTSMANRFNAFANLIRSEMQIAEGFSKKAGAVKNKAKAGSSSWAEKEQTVNYSGSHMLILAGNRGFSDPIKDIKRDMEVSKYILLNYPKTAVASIKQLHNILSSGDYSSEDTISKTVFSKLTNLKHPVDSFDKSYFNEVYFGVMRLGDNVSMFSRMGNAIKKAFTSSKDTKGLDVLEQKGHYRYVGEWFIAEDGQIRPWTVQEAIANLAPTNAIIDGVVSGLGNDITKVRNEDLFTMLDYVISYRKLLSDAKTQFNKDAVELQQSTKTLVNVLNAKMKNAKGREKYILNRILRLVKNYQSTYFEPQRTEIFRVLHVMRSIYNLANNAVKRAK